MENSVEIEVKILEINKEEVEEKIKKHGGVKVKEGILKSWYFDYEDNRLRKEGAIIRVRSYDKETFMDYKKVMKKGKYKEAEEIKIIIEDFEKAVLFLKKIGLKAIKKLEKKRTSYKLLNSFVEIDEIEGIPVFLEIEGKKEEIEEIIEMLEIKDKKRVSFNTEELFSYYSKRF